MKHKDKLLHFGVCLATGILSPMLAIGLAIGKEYGDSKATGNHWCLWDMLFNILGILLAIIIKYIISINN